MFKEGDKVICNMSHVGTFVKYNLKSGKIYTILDSNEDYSSLIEIAPLMGYNNSRFDTLNELRTKKLKQLEECSKKEIK